MALLDVPLVLKLGIYPLSGLVLDWDGAGNFPFSRCSLVLVPLVFARFTLAIMIK
jgi:hypothetical protein